jgi:segregation and condensation protein B
MADDPPDPAVDAAREAARRLAGAWQLDAEEVLFEPAAEDDEPAGGGRQPPVPPPGPRPAEPTGGFRPPPAPAGPPPSPERIAEAMLFVGGPPLTAEQFCTAVRVPEDVFRRAIDALSRRYAAQGRPYAVRPSGDGFVIAVLPGFRRLREKLAGGPKEVRLSPAALDVLAVVAYRQPVGKADVDTVRGADSAAALRQLVRLGLVARRGDGGTAYGTTPRFLSLLGLAGLDDLPRPGPPEPGSPA